MFMSTIDSIPHSIASPTLSLTLLTPPKSNSLKTNPILSSYEIKNALISKRITFLTFPLKPKSKV